MRFAVATSVLLGIACSFLCFVQDAQSKANTNDQAQVRVEYQSWKDEKRNRAIPVKLYIPSHFDSPAPVVVFSHGLGGSREAAGYLGSYWAAHGYVAAFIQHPGSDQSFWQPEVSSGNIRTKGALLTKFKATVADPTHAINRANDVHFVLDELRTLNETDPVLKGKLNLDEIAIAGHSFGSWTALTASGQRMVTPRGREISSPDSRIKAAIYLSPTSPRKNADPVIVFGGIEIPGLHLTGTLDQSLVADTKPAERRIAFDNITKSDQYLIVLKDADHMVFGGRARMRVNERDQLHQEITQKTSTAFLDAYLRHDAQAKRWLQAEAQNYIGSHGTYESKMAGDNKASTKIRGSL